MAAEPVKVDSPLVAAATAMVSLAGGVAGGSISGSPAGGNPLDHGETASVAKVPVAGSDGSSGSASVQSAVPGAAMAVAKVRPTGLGTWVAQLSAGEGELFSDVDKSRMVAGFFGCALCGKSFSDTSLLDGRHEVKVLQCFHSVCSDCLTRCMAEGGQDDFVCPLCQYRQPRQSLHLFLPHFELHSVMDTEKIAQSDFQCEECIGGTRAEAYCEECHMHMCEFCVKQHRRARSSVRHTLRPLRGQVVEEKSLQVDKGPKYVHRAQYCAIHRAFKYDFYCEDCDALICMQCAVEAHESHCYKLPSASLIDRHRAKIQEMIEKLCSQLFEAQELQESVRCSFGEAEAGALQVRAQVEEAFDGLLRASEDRCAELQRMLTDASAEHIKGLEAAKGDCSRALVESWRTVDFLEKTLSRGTDIEVLRVKGQLHQQHQQQIQRWQLLVQKPLPVFFAPGAAPKGAGSSGSTCSAGWRSAQEQEDFIRRLEAFGRTETTGGSTQCGEVVGIASRTQRRSWADLMSCDSADDVVEEWLGALPPLLTERKTSS